MKNKLFLVEESLNKYGDKKSPKIKKMRDIYSEEPNPEELKNLEDTIIDDIDIDDDEDIYIEESGSLETALKNELLKPEIDRNYLRFSIFKDSTDKILEAIPMAEMSDGEAFLFKLKEGGYKKIFVKDIIEE